MPHRTSATSPAPMGLADYQALAAYRFALRRFLHFSGEAARKGGITPQQYQVLLAIAAEPPGEFLNVGELAVLMHLRHHSAVGLVDRLVQRGLLQRVTDKEDRRRVRVRLTTRGEDVLGRLAATHRDELRRLGPELVRSLQSLNAG